MSLIEEINKQEIFYYKKLTFEMLEYCIRKAFKPKEREFVFYVGATLCDLLDISTVLSSSNIDYTYKVIKRGNCEYYISLFEKSGLYKLKFFKNGTIGLYKGTLLLYISDSLGESIINEINKLK